MVLHTSTPRWCHIRATTVSHKYYQDYIAKEHGYWIYSILKLKFDNKNTKIVKINIQEKNAIFLKNIHLTIYS